MKKGYNSSDIPQQEGQDQARRLHRAISDSARRLDDARGCARSVSDLFAPALLAQRSRLRDSCERLIFLDPVLYGRKGEELLWRKVYYDVVATAKRLKQHAYSGPEVAHLCGHINAGIGYYHHFVSRLQLELEACVLGAVDFPICTSPTTTTATGDNQWASVRDWAELCVHRCLIYLGDLTRYTLDVQPAWDRGLAVRYYLQAAAFKPAYGMPHNQLGTLASSLGRPLDAVYHYMRGLGCTHIFDGTENNLQRLLEKNSYVVEGLPVDGGAVPPGEHVGQLLARFLLLVDLVYFEKRGAHLHSLCHQVLLDFRTCLAYPSPVASESGDSEQPADGDEPPGFLSADTVFRMVIVCVLCVGKLQHADTQQRLSSLKAFLLAVYSHLVHTVIEHIEDSVLNVPAAHNGAATKRSRSKLRRRKLQRTSDEDEESDVSESDVSFSSGSEPCSAASYSSGEDSDSKPVPNGGAVLVNGDAGVGPRTQRMDPVDLVAIVADEGLLASVKVLSDWLVGDVVVLRECATSTQVLLPKVVQLLNLVHTGNKRCWRTSRDLDCGTVPLPEDVVLRGVPVLHAVHRHINWAHAHGHIMEPDEEVRVRIDKLVAFGGLLADIPETGISYDKKRKCFAIAEVRPPPPQQPDAQHVNEQPGPHKEAISRGKLMKDMGQLWLAAEVQDLESRVQGRAAFSPYLVLDVDALIHYTHLAKQFVSARKFIVLVPVIVLSALDELKRETIKAREAIRWLETQFHRGNRFLRAQRPQERAPVPLIKYPKKRDRDTHTFIQIIECCHFLAQQQKGAASNLVTLLTGSQSALGVAEARELSRIGLAHSAGVSLELITAFHMKWRKSVKGHR